MEDTYRSNPQDGGSAAGRAFDAIKAQPEPISVTEARERVEKALDALNKTLGELPERISPILNVSGEYPTTQYEGSGACSLAEGILAYWIAIESATLTLRRIYERIGL